MAQANMALAQGSENHAGLARASAGGFDLVLERFGLPAEDIEAAAGIDDFMDDPALTADRLRSFTLADIGEHLSVLNHGICADGHSEARHKIYLCKMLLRDTLSEELTQPELILQPTGDAVIDEITLYCRLDISHWPLRLVSWERLAGEQEAVS